MELDTIPTPVIVPPVNTAIATLALNLTFFHHRSFVIEPEFRFGLCGA